MLMHWLIVYHFHFRWDRLGEKSFIIQTLITSLSVKLVHLKPISHDIPTFTGCAFLFSQSLQRNLNQFFFFWSNLLVRSVSSRHPFRKSTEGRDFLTRIIPDLCQFLFPALFQTRWLGPSVQTCCAHTSGRKKILSPHIAISLKVVYVHLCVCLLLPRSKACRAPVTWYVGRDRHTRMTA